MQKEKEGERGTDGERKRREMNERDSWKVEKRERNHKGKESERK